MKLFLLVKAPATLKLPMHFLPKRDFKYHKKVSRSFTGTDILVQIFVTEPFN